MVSDSDNRFRVPHPCMQDATLGKKKYESPIDGSELKTENSNLKLENLPAKKHDFSVVRFRGQRRTYSTVKMLLNLAHTRT